jgi:hypothetical protein
MISAWSNVLTLIFDEKTWGSNVSSYVVLCGLDD